MKMLVESLKRMYKKGTLTEEQIAERVTKGSISAEEYEYITDVSGVKWLYVAYKNVVGFASSKYLKK